MLYKNSLGKTYLLNLLTIISLNFTTNIFSATQKRPVVKQNKNNQLGPVREIKTLKEYDKIYAQPQPTIINCYATSCGACKHMDEDYSKKAATYGKKIRFCRVDLDNKEFAPLFKKHKIVGIPTTLFIKNGEEQRRERGAVYGQYLDDTIYRFANGNDAADKRIIKRQQTELAKQKKLNDQTKSKAKTESLPKKIDK